MICGAKNITTFHDLIPITFPESTNINLYFYDRINNSQLSELIVTDTLRKEHKSDKVKVIEVGNLFADTINRVFTKQSISSNFIS